MDLNVSIYVPADFPGKDSAIEAATRAFVDIDADGVVPVTVVDGDIVDALSAAKAYADSSDGLDLVVIFNSGKGNRGQAERLIEELADESGGGNFIVLVQTDEDSDTAAWFQNLDDHAPRPNHVDVLTVADFGSERALNEVGPWSAIAGS